MNRRMLRDVQREARLADRQPRRDQDQIALLEPRRQRVQIGEPGPNAADLAAVGVEVIESVVGVMQEVVELAEANGDAPVADLEELRLRPVDRLLDLRRILVADAGDLAGGPDEVPQ